MLGCCLLCCLFVFCCVCFVWVVVFVLCVFFCLGSSGSGFGCVRFGSWLFFWFDWRRCLRGLLVGSVSSVLSLPCSLFAVCAVLVSVCVLGFARVPSRWCLCRVCWCVCVCVCVVCVCVRVWALGFVAPFSVGCSLLRPVGPRSAVVPLARFALSSGAASTFVARRAAGWWLLGPPPLGWLCPSPGRGSAEKISSPNFESSHVQPRPSQIIYKVAWCQLIAQHNEEPIIGSRRIILLWPWNTVLQKDRSAKIKKKLIFSLAS